RGLRADRARRWSASAGGNRRRRDPERASCASSVTAGNPKAAPHELPMRAAAPTARVEASNKGGVMATIVVGTDGSEAATAALEQAIALAKASSDQLVVVTAWRELRGDFGL